MQERFPYLLPVTIIIAGVILAAAIYIVRTNAAPGLMKADASQMRPLTETDHIVGTPEAPVVVVTYSDIDCEYCKSFQATMSELMNEYAPDGRVAWVYRHFPIVSVHAHAAMHAEATECVASIAGEQAFWRFIDRMHQEAPDSIQFDPAGYTKLAPSFGIDPSELERCVLEGRFADRVTKDFEDGLAVGVAGTPHSIVVIRGSDPISIKGALPYESMKRVIETALERVK